MNNLFITTLYNLIFSFNPTLVRVKKINLLPLGWGKQIDFLKVTFFLVNIIVNITLYNESIS